MFGLITIEVAACLAYIYVALIMPLQKAINERETRTTTEIRKSNKSALLWIGIFSFLSAVFSGQPIVIRLFIIIVPIIFMTLLMRASRLSKGFMQGSELPYFLGFCIFALLYFFYSFSFVNPFQGLIVPFCLIGIFICFFRLKKSGRAVGITTMS